MISY
jgi:hypothetical protein